MPNDEQLEPPFTIFVDDDPVTVESRRVTVRKILELSSNLPVEEFSLLAIAEGEYPEAKYDNPDQIVTIRPKQRFAALNRGGTPLS